MTRGGLMTPAAPTWWCHLTSCEHHGLCTPPRLSETFLQTEAAWISVGARDSGGGGEKKGVEVTNAQPRRKRVWGRFLLRQSLQLALEPRSLTSVVGHPCPGDTMNPPSHRWGLEWWGWGQRRQKRVQWLEPLHARALLHLQGGP